MSVSPSRVVDFGARESMAPGCDTGGAIGAFSGALMIQYSQRIRHRTQKFSRNGLVLAGWLRAQITGIQAPAPVVVTPGLMAGDPVVIVAMGCRLPGGVAGQFGTKYSELWSNGFGVPKSEKFARTTTCLSEPG